jgi:lipoprotein-releasing system permease protein
VIAIGLAVAVSVTSVSLQAGFQEYLLDIIVKDLAHVSVSPKEGEEYIYLYRTLMERIWKLEGVTAVSPRLSTSASLSHKNNVENVILIGVIPSEMERIYPSIEERVIYGDLESIQQENRIAMSKKLAEKLDVELDDTVDARFPDANPLNLMIACIFDPPQGFPEEMAFVSLRTARNFVGEGDVINGIDIKLQDIYMADRISREISATGYKAESWQQLYPEILRTIAIENFENNIIMLLIMIIAAFGIASVMYMLVLEKTSEIGMLMAEGATGVMIRNIFLIQSTVLGLIGGICGAVGGVALSLYLKGMGFEVEAPGWEEFVLPVVIDPWKILIIVLVAVLLSLAAGVYPAHKASKLDPVIALRG